MIGNIMRGRGSRGRSSCCKLEVNQVSEPVAVLQGYTSESSSIEVLDYDMGFTPQSEEVIVTFMDDNTAVPAGSTSGNHVFSEQDTTRDTDISEFFRRPVRISSNQWNEGTSDGVYFTLEPWHLWANNSYVKPKLNNYSWIRGDLKIKIQMSSSPFYYGKMKVIYQPLPNFTPSTIVNSGGVEYFIPYSQRPHISLYPGGDDSYEMTLPFIYPANWLNVQSAQEFKDMGKLDFFVWNGLQDANASVASLSITTYAWLENIQLSGASVGFSVQSDEYGEGPVSKPASWVASAASYFEDIPVIGPFATATKIGAGAISAIASLFGFTNVPVIEDSTPMRSEVFPKLASSEIGFPIEKLTLDPKNELSVDPRIIGLSSGDDELAIKNIVTRESFLTKLQWTQSDLPDDYLFMTRINPNMYDITADTDAKLYMTPMSFTANCFSEWRGSVIFRFEIICTKFHKGKLLIQFDPSGYSSQNIINTTGVSNVVHTVIMDIGAEKSVEVVIPYQQATQFLTNRPGLTAANKNWKKKGTTSAFNYNKLYDNGTLVVRVLNTLTAPVASSNVDLNIYVRAGDDLEFANPVFLDNTNTLTMFTPQSEEVTQSVDVPSLELAPTVGAPEKQYLVHYGENIKSLRQLLRRYQLQQIDNINFNVTANKWKFWQKSFYKMPLYPGYISNGYRQANKITTAGTYNYNFANLTYLTYLSPAFIAYRGSVNYTFNVDADIPVANLRVWKENVFGGVAGVGTIEGSGSTQNQIAASIYEMEPGAAGQALTNQLTQTGINVQCPNYSKFKFQSTSPMNANLGVQADGSIYDKFILEGFYKIKSADYTDNTTIFTYAGAGTDFNLFFFLNVPTMYLYRSAPTPA